MKATTLKPIVADKNLIAYCGLYCGACKAYLKGKCPGCRENTKATWCKVRSCGIENNIHSCADCTSIELMECKKFNNWISKAIGFMMNSDRPACINRIKETSPDAFAEEMAASKRHSIKRK